MRILLGPFFWRLSVRVQLVGKPWVDPEHTGDIIYLAWEHHRIPKEELENDVVYLTPILILRIT